MFDKSALYFVSSRNIIRVNVLDRMRLECSTHGETEGERINAYKVIVLKPHGEILFGGSTGRWEVNINRDLKEVGRESVGWVCVAVRIGTIGGFLWVN
jgi:hypothetical protein